MTSETQRHASALPPTGEAGKLAKPHTLDPKTPVTHEEAFEIAKRFIDYRFGNDNEVPRASIPCNLERDDDVRLHAYIRQNARLSTRLAEAELDLANAEELQRDAGRELEQYSNEIAAQRARAERAVALLRKFFDFANSGQHFFYPPGSLQELDAALSAPASAPGDGWVLVPREPTEAMLDAADAADAQGLSAEPYGDLYRAMIAASPAKGERT